MQDSVNESGTESAAKPTTRWRNTTSNTSRSASSFMAGIATLNLEDAIAEAKRHPGAGKDGEG